MTNIAPPQGPKLDPREEQCRLMSPLDGHRLFLRYLPPAVPGAGGAPRIVLYVHGATFPSALSIAHRFDGRSWRDALCAAGLHVWGLDFLGFGGSDRYPEMAAPAAANAPPGRAEDAALQIAAAVRCILGRHAAARLSIIAHSWGTIAACRFAALYPALVDRLVLFGPVARRTLPGHAMAAAAPAWRIVTPEQQYARFVEDVPAHAAPVLSRAHFDAWAEAYLDSDAESRGRTPAGVKVPGGPAADIARAWRGELGYAPAEVTAPVAIIRRAWDGVSTDADARWLFDAFTGVAVKQDLKIGRGTHLMHLEAMRHALHDASIAFLGGGTPEGE